MAVDDKTEPQEEAAKDPIKETILQTSRLFVRNLTFSCTQEELEEHFRPFGTITQVRARSTLFSFLPFVFVEPFDSSPVLECL